MDEAEYRAALTAELDLHTIDAASRVQAVVQQLPAKARALTFEIIPDQDGEGTFTVMAALDGPDLFVLNKSIREHARILEVKHTADGLDPPVPLLDPFAEFDVNCVLVDVVAVWMQAVWKAAAPSSAIPVNVIGHEGYGTVTPVNLHRPSAV